MHRKGRADKIRSKLFTKLSREITVSAKLGTPDPEMNPRLRAAVQAARAANNGAYPPDLSLIVKARPKGADYLKALLLGYVEAPAGKEVPEGQYYNKYMAGNKIKMPNNLIDGLVEYADGTESTVDQMAKDVTTFLAWAAEPELEERHKTDRKSTRLNSSHSSVSRMPSSA